MYEWLLLVVVWLKDVQGDRVSPSMLGTVLPSKFCNVMELICLVVTLWDATVCTNWQLHTVGLNKKFAFHLN